MNQKREGKFRAKAVSTTKGKVGKTGQRHATSFGEKFLWVQRLAIRLQVERNMFDPESFHRDYLSEKKIRLKQKRGSPGKFPSPSRQSQGGFFAAGEE